MYDTDRLIPSENRTMPAKSSFARFPNETLRFLRGIRKNNTKSWFDAHRADYDRYYVDPAKAFVEAVGRKLKKLAGDFVAEPRINGSIFRINRDIRFSNDKRPYRDHLDFAFWEGEKKKSASSLFFRVSPDGVYVGTGYHACPQMLNAFRSAVADEDSGKALMKVARGLRKAGYELEGKHYKRMPRGYSEECPAHPFLLHNGLYVVTEEKPETACEDGIVDRCFKHWKAAMPLHRWLMSHVRT